MTREQAAAFVFSQSVCAVAAIEGMKAENAERENGGYGPTYGEGEFSAVPEQYGIGRDAVLQIFHNADG